MKFDLIFFNNSTKKSYLFPKNEDLGNGASYRFDGLDFSQFPSGEYTYVVLRNDRNDVVYEPSEIPLNTLIKTNEGNVYLRDLAYESGICKIKGNRAEEVKVTYRNRNIEFNYYHKKERDF